MSWRILEGDVRELLATLPDRSVQCCVTSPPYWGLRDYGTATWDGGDLDCKHIQGRTGASNASGYTVKPSPRNRDGVAALTSGACDKCGARRIDSQIGLEPTPYAYVQTLLQVFREVKRVLKDDGTLWLNLGDSYVGGGRGGGGSFAAERPGWDDVPMCFGEKRSVAGASGLKPKDICGIPWRVAFALQAPYYTGTIKSREDRIWLAAMLDAEGCMFIHKRKAGQNNGQGYQRQNDNYGPGLEISNTSQRVVERCMEIAGIGSICTQDEGRQQRLYRWNVRTTQSRELVRELYPHLVAKQQQARILYGCPSSGERAEAAHAALMALHRTGASGVDFPAPPSCLEPGWYLRSDVIWSKLNPMPESVTDRPTKAHEYIFLLSKSARYYYDAEAIAEPFRDYVADRIRNEAARGMTHQLRDKYADVRGDGGITSSQAGAREHLLIKGRNCRSVWELATQPYPEAHFATFPEALPERCIKAGSRPGDTVLDPFCGAGTTGLVADRLNRDFIGIELNPAYRELARERIRSVLPMFDNEASA